MRFDLFRGKMYDTVDEIEACSTICPSKQCVRNHIHRKQMWFGDWVEGEPKKKKDCKNYIRKSDERIAKDIRNLLPI